MEKAELVLIPTIGAGHLISMVEYAKLLINMDTRISITILIMKFSFDSNITQYIQSLGKNPTERLSLIDLPEPQKKPIADSERVSLTGLQPKPTAYSPLTFFNAILETQMSIVRETVANMASRPDFGRLTAFVVDMFNTAMIDVANEFGVPTYSFFTSSAAFLGFKLFIQSLKDDYDKDISDYKNSGAELAIPCFENSVPPKVLPSVVLTKEGSAFVISSARRLRRSKGILINTFMELERTAIKSLSESRSPIIYHIGPLLNLKGTLGDAANVENNIMHWLDSQPPSSVVFLCFGSMSSFVEAQVIEIAKALECSGHRFLWSLRRPPLDGAVPQAPGDYDDPSEVLPEGFLERTAGLGRVIGWAPQTAILSHQSVGGFVTHCGWNSILESLWFGVPMATLPMYAEQQLNAFQMVVDLHLAVEIKLDYRKDSMWKSEDSGIVTADEIERGVRQLMEGESNNRKRVKEMSEMSKAAMVEGGSSYKSLGSFIDDILKNIF